MRVLPQLRPGRRIALAALAAVAVAACTNNDTAIYYYLENEKPVIDFTLDNQSTINGMGAGAGLYFVSLGGSMWQRESTGNVWSGIDLPGGTSYCGPLVVFQGRIYVSLLTGSSWALWSGNTATAPTWTRVTDADIDGKQITGLFVVGPSGTERLFASAQEGVNSYALYSSPNGADNSFVASGFAGAAKQISQVTWDGVQYYAAAATQIVRGAAAGGMTTAVGPAVGAANINGVFYSGSYLKYYAATDTGLLLSSTDGTSWTESSGEIDVSGTTVRFMRINEVPTVPGNIMIGTMEHGPYQLKTGVVTSHQRLLDTTDTELYNGEVLDLFMDPATPGLVFALTGGSGLWHSTYNGADFSDWNRE